MNDDILDAQAHVNPDNWDSKTRIKISDAIIEVNDHLKKVKFGRYLLFGLAGINFLFPVMVLFTSDQPTEVIYASTAMLAVVVLPFIAFGVFYPKKPLLFLILGLVVYLLYLVLTMVLLNEGIMQGSIWKVGTLTAFGVSIYGVSQWKNNLEKLRELGYPTSAVTDARNKFKPLPRLRKKKKI